MTMRPDVARHLSDVDVTALTLHHEAASEGVTGMAAVACVLRNRVAWGKWGSTFADVCLARAQFSCWRPAGGTTNFARLSNNADAIRAGRRPTRMATAYEIAKAVIAGTQEDITGGADSYYAPKSMVPKDRIPSWAEGQTPTAVIGGHRFYRLRPAWPARIGDLTT
jgi:spore germination cell wall hydrolase CwlJ-like protein